MIREDEKQTRKSSFSKTMKIMEDYSCKTWWRKY
jgi:hypothetical protein